MRRLTKEALLLTVALTSGCTPGLFPRLSFTETPSPSPKATSLPSSTPSPEPTFTRSPLPTIIPSLTPTLVASLEDGRIRSLVLEAREGETILINNPNIGYLARSPWIERGEAIIATLDTQKESEPAEYSRTAIIFSADCIYDSFRQEGSLGRPPFPGLWHPNQRLDRLQAKVLSSFSVADPKPLLDAKSITYRGKNYDCREVKALDSLTAAVKGFDWEQLPEGFGELLTKILLRIGRGIEKGLTPTR